MYLAGGYGKFNRRLASGSARQLCANLLNASIKEPEEGCSPRLEESRVRRTFLQPDGSARDSADV